MRAFLPIFGLALATLTPAQEIPHTPENHWIYSAFDRLKKLNLLANEPASYPLTWSVTRLEAAKMLGSSLKLMPGILDLRLDRYKADKSSAQSFPGQRLKVDIDRLVIVLTPEIVQMGSSPESLKRVARSAWAKADDLRLLVEGGNFPEVDENHWGYEALDRLRGRRRFDDVGSHHWAAKAVNELKDSGLLKGLPAEKKQRLRR